MQHLCSYSGNMCTIRLMHFRFGIVSASSPLSRNGHEVSVQTNNVRCPNSSDLIWLSKQLTTALHFQRNNIATVAPSKLEMI